MPYDIWHRELKQNVVVQIPFKFIWNRLSPYVDASYIRGAVIEWIFPIYFQDVTVPNLIKNPWQRAVRRGIASPIGYWIQREIYA